MGVIFKIIIMILLGFVGKRVYTIVNYLGFGNHVYNHSPGPCRILDGIDKGSEDIEISSNGIAFITSGMKSFLDITDPKFSDRNGKIFTFDFKKPDQKPVELKIMGDIDTSNWGPHGISLHENKKTGKVTVFVIVHRPSGDSIERFSYIASTNTLQHIETVTGDEHIRHTNDVKATSENSFYLTNIQYSKTKIGQNLEGLLGFEWGNVVYYDGEKFKIAADKIASPNGINMSPDGRYVYLVVNIVKGIRVFKREKDNTLHYLKDIELHTIPDNIDVDQTTGDLWTGAHPIGYKCVKYLQDPTFQSPSQVLRLKMKDGAPTSITEMYMDDGAVLKGSTIAAHYKGAFLVGTAHDKALYCQIKKEKSTLT